ncbi:MAG TPA: hypothetical protein VF796_15815 [Humisphaera sp.]
MSNHNVERAAAKLQDGDADVLAEVLAHCGAYAGSGFKVRVVGTLLGMQDWPRSERLRSAIKPLTEPEILALPDAAAERRPDRRRKGRR